MRGEISSGRHSKRHPYDWYVEEYWVTAQLYRALGGFAQEKREGLAVWDPAAGLGTIGGAFLEDGHRVFYSDIVERIDWARVGEFDAEVPPSFRVANFLDLVKPPAPCSVVCNPPYSYIEGIAEAFVRHALRLTHRRVCMLVPVKWLASQVRYGLFAEDHPPQAILYLTQRPSMPPGDRIEAMGNRAFRGGMIDYCWIVWDVKRPTPPGFTRSVWLPPLHRSFDLLPIEGIA